MKNVFSNILFLLVFNFAFGQIEWVGNHEFSEAAQGILKTSSGQYVLLHGNGSGITAFSNNGDIVFNSSIANLFSYTELGASRILELSDSTYMYIEGGVECDIFTYYIIKFDKDWNLLSLNYCNGNGPMAMFSDQSVAIVGKWNDSFERITPSGNKIWEKELYPKRIADIAINSADKILVATDNGLFEYNANGSITDSLPNFVVDRLEILPNGNFLTQTSDNLFLFSPGFNQLNMVFGLGDSITDIAVKGNEIGVLTTTPKILRYDLGLNPIGTVPLTGQNQTFTSMDFDGNDFVVAGGEQYGEGVHQNTSAFIKQFGLDGSTINTNEDISIVDIKLTGVVETMFVTPQLYQAALPTASITVKNNGNSVVNTLNLNLGFPDFNVWLWECKEVQVFSRIFENLNLQPGATVQLDWANQSIYFGNEPIGMELEMCYWASIPNNHLDINNDNDGICESILISSQKEIFPVHFIHYYNIASKELYFELNSALDAENATANIFNAAGQIVHSKSVSEIRQTVDLSAFPDGVYFLQIITGNRVGVAKFAKY